MEKCFLPTATLNSKKYPNFYGHYGTAWQNQQKEFAQFPGAILMTTNCIQRPMESYKSNIFTSWTRRLPRRTPHRWQRLLASNPESPSATRLPRRCRRQNRHGRFRQKRSSKRSRQSYRFSQERAHQTLHLSRRMRRSKTRTQLLHRIR